MMLDRRLQLFDVFGSALTECRLGLAVSLLSFLRRGIDLEKIQHRRGVAPNPFLTGFRPPLRFCTWAFSGTKFGSSNSGEVSEKLPSSDGSALGTPGTSSPLAMATISRVAETLPT